MRASERQARRDKLLVAALGGPRCHLPLLREAKPELRFFECAKAVKLRPLHGSLA